MIHVVTGLHRSGTTMMIRALAAAGDFDVLAHRSMDEAIARNHRDDSYHPNPHGYWQVDLAQVEERDPRTMAWVHLQHGRLFKAPAHDLLRLLPGDYRIVFMRRDFEEVKASYHRAFGWDYDEQDEYLAQDVMAMLRMRKDVSLTEVNFVDVLENPVREFTYLAMRGWLIVPQLAAAIVEPGLYRNRGMVTT